MLEVLVVKLRLLKISEHHLDDFYRLYSLSGKKVNDIYLSVRDNLKHSISNANPKTYKR